jgi:hypothetical protein
MTFDPDLIRRLGQRTELLSPEQMGQADRAAADLNPYCAVETEQYI